MRPLYQEIILPNISYVGGGAEISYWLQLKSVFDLENVPLPILVLRSSIMLISLKAKKDSNEKGFNLKDIFLSKEELHKKYVLNNFSKEISLNKEYIKLKEIYEKIRLKTSDVGLQSSLQAQIHKQLNWVSNFEKNNSRKEKRMQ